MTNKEILQADMLDILFEHRNKAYGAYALRRDYDRRLLTALGAAMSVILLFVFINVWGNKKEADEPSQPSKDIIKPMIIPVQDIRKPGKPKEVVKPKELPKPPEKVSTAKYTKPVITPDEKTSTTEMPDKDEVNEKAIGDENKDGKKPAGLAEPAPPPASTGNEKTGDEEKPLKDFIPESSGPEFPGGPEALHRYFAKNLNTPDELNSGEKKTVRIRFWVGKDGSVSALEIEQTAGDIFDKEVIRVCKKMPRWKPAVQNGEKVAVSYLLPVTFIGVEQ